MSDSVNQVNKLLESNTSTNTLLNSIVQRADDLDTRIDTLKDERHNQVVQLDNQENWISELEKNLQHAIGYIDQLENQYL